MSKYKENLYQKYVSTHISPTKGEPNKKIFKQKSNVWNKTFRKHLPEDNNSRIIDLGCGDGSIVWWLQKNGFSNATGIEISSEQVKIARSMGVKNIEEYDLKKFMTGKENCYDLIIARDILEHFRKSDMIEILFLCYHSLTSKGKIIIQVPNAESPFGMRIRYGDLTHEIAFTSSSLSQALNIVGFESIIFFPVGPRILSIKSLIRFMLWKIIEFIYKLLLFVEIGPGKRIVTQDIIAVAIK